MERIFSMCGIRVKSLGRCGSIEPPFCKFAVITWANEGNHSSTPTGHCRCFAPLVRPQTAQPCSQCGKSRVKSRPPFPAQWPRRCLSHCLSHWSGVLSCHLLPPHSISSSIHSIRSFLSPSIMVILTSIRGASFKLPIPRGGLLTPGCSVCLHLSRRTWIEQPLRVDLWC